MAGLCECGKPVYAKGMCKSCYNLNWYYKHSELQKARMRLYNKTHPERNGIKFKKQTCEIIKQHHEAMKDDPEHLTTEFIKKLIKIDCKEV